MKKWFVLSICCVHALVGEPEYLLDVGVKEEPRLELLNSFYNPASLAFLEKVGLDENACVLDIGAGSGLMAIEMAKKAQQVTYLDNSHDQLEVAKNNIALSGLNNLHPCLLSCYALEELPEASFDIIFCRFLLMHLQSPDEVLEGIYRLLKPGGCFVSVETLGDYTITAYPSSKGLEDFVELGVRQFQLQQSDSAIGYKLPSKMAQVGFKDLDIEFFHPVLRTQKEKSFFQMDVETLSHAFIRECLESEESMEEMKRALHAFIVDEQAFGTYYEISLIKGVKPKVQL